jgi:hypothetical protein
MLSNFETHNAKLLQIILAGQPRLATKLAQPKLIQLRQRIAVLSHLEPFTAKETASYIAHRLTIAWHSGEPVFDASALDEIAKQSDGIPRNINNICFNSMLMSFSRGQRTVNAETVRKAVASLDLEALISAPVKVTGAVPTLPASPVPISEAIPGSSLGLSVTHDPIPEISGSHNIAPVVSAISDIVPEAVPASVPAPTQVSTPAPIPPITHARTSVPASNATTKTVSKPTQAPVIVPPKKVRSSNDFISYDATKKLNLKKWQVRSVIVTAILLSAILALAILGRSQSNRGITPNVFDTTSGAMGPLLPSVQSETSSASYDAAPMETNNGEILTVAASANQSIRDLSMRYTGHFDSELAKNIRSLNPDMKDPDHLEAGELVRIPLPPGAMRKMNDTGESPTPGVEKSGSLLSKFTDLLEGKK